MVCMLLSVTRKAPRGGEHTSLSSGNFTYSLKSSKQTTLENKKGLFKIKRIILLKDCAFFIIEAFYMSCLSNLRERGLFYSGVRSIFLVPKDIYFVIHIAPLI